MKQRNAGAMTGGQIAGFCAMGFIVLALVVVDLGIYGGSWISGDGQESCQPAQHAVSADRGTGYLVPCFYGGGRRGNRVAPGVSHARSGSRS